MQIEGLSWYPGHMTKTKRMIVAEMGHMDAVCEILDARIPISSRNPDVDEMTAGKPRLVVLNRVDQADPKETARWAAYFRGKGYAVLESNAKNGVGTAQFAAAVRELLKDKLQSYADKGQVGRVVRVMVLGIPNVGKSTFINKVAKRKTAKAEEQKVDKLIAELYEYYLTHVDQMSNFYVQLAYQEGRERAVTDYISGMSDEFAIRTFEELFVPQKWHVL